MILNNYVINITYNFNKTFLLLLSIILISSQAIYADGLPDNWIGPDNLIEEKRFGDYDVKIYQYKELGYPGMLHIFKGDQLVYEEEGNLFQIGLIYSEAEGGHPLNNGTDMTGDGIPNLVISQWSGGAHCCLDFRVFSLGDEIKLIANINVDDADRSYFEDLNNDGILEFISRDFTYAYWNTTFADSPAPQFILKYSDGQYVLASELMKKPVGEASDYVKLKKRFNFAYKDKADGKCDGWKRGDACVTPDVWSHMLYLIYAGHANEAWTFLDNYWSYSDEDKQWFIYDFKKKLAASWYASELDDELFGYGSVAVGRHEEYFKKWEAYLNESEEKE